jgi:hypothetical protein
MRYLFRTALDLLAPSSQNLPPVTSLQIAVPPALATVYMLGTSSLAGFRYGGATGK